MEEELSYEGSYRSPEALYDPFRRRSMMMRKKESVGKEKGDKKWDCTVRKLDICKPFKTRKRDLSFLVRVIL